MLPGDLPTVYAFGYLSTPTVEFSERELNQLLLAARAWNGRRKISGKLIVLEEGERVVRFAQWIEGPREEIELCMQRIYADTRHGAIDVQWQGETTGRRFGGWDMAYDTFEPSEWTGVAPGLVDESI